MLLSEIRNQIKKRLKDAGIESYEYDTWTLIEYGLGISRQDYYMDPDIVIGQEAFIRLDRMVSERARRRPLQYITGEAGFMDYTFSVNDHVLIPRQDTESLIEYTLKEIKERRPQRGGSERLKILDLCTGSGCIGISMKKMLPDAELTLSDNSPEALVVARSNAARLKAQVHIIESDLFDKIQGSFDYILSNPPYIPTGDIPGLMPEVGQYEPKEALDGREDGLCFYRKIIEQAPDHLLPGGRIVFEIGAGQGEEIRKLFMDHGYREIEILKDLAGYDRVARACVPG